MDEPSRQAGASPYRVEPSESPSEPNVFRPIDNCTTSGSAAATRFVGASSVVVMQRFTLVGA